MAMTYGPISKRLGRARMPAPGLQDPNAYDEDAMPPGQGDLGEETMAGEQSRMDPQMVGRPGMGPMGRALMVHSPAEAQRQRGYGMPQLDRPGIPSTQDPSHATDAGELHTAQHQSIARSLQQRRWMAQQKLVLEHQRLSQIIRSARAGQDVEKAQQQLAAIEGLLRSLGPLETGQPGE